MAESHFFDNAKAVFAKRIPAIRAEVALAMAQNRGIDVNEHSEVVCEHTKLLIYGQILGNAMNVFLYLNALDDPQGDQAQASARELLKAIAKLAKVDLEEQYSFFDR